MTTLLVDADILAYRCAFHRETAEESEGYWTWKCNLEDVQSDVLNYLDWLQQRLDASSYILCLSDTKNFRHGVSETYKGNRSWMKRPVVLKPLKAWMIETLEAQIYPTLEGDDVMGILATSMEDTIVVSLDKDLKSVPGRFYRSEADGVVDISLEEADYYHLYQTLIGDPGDGYKGCPGIGAAKATKMLDKSPTWQTVVDTYVKAGLTEEDALVQARQARILRSSDYDHVTKQPILWSPYGDN